MSKVLEGADKDLENLANVVQQGIADTDSGAGMAEVVIDIINKKVAWMNQLLKRCDQLDTEHLEYSRAQRKHQEVEKKGDAARIAESAALLKKEKDDLQKALQLFEREFASIFCNSRLADNSLVDVMSMNKSKDYLVYDGLKNMFNDEKLVELSKTNGINNIDTNNVLSLKREERRKRRDDLF